MPPRSRWPRVLECLRSNSLSLGQASTILGRFGLWEEASCLDDPGRIDAGLALVLAGKVLTAADLNYPRQWIDKLGASAPPVLWKEGVFPSVDWVGIVGSRAVSDSVRFATCDVALDVLRLGRGVVTGGAVGCDEAAVDGALSCGTEGAGRTAVLLPRGIEAGTPAEKAKVRRWVRSGVCVLSVNAPTADFAAGLAMERNALIYALSDQTVAMAAELRSGGTWTGAVDALRRRLCVLGVPVGESEMPGLSALRRLGALSVCLGEDVCDRDDGALGFEEFVRLKIESDQPSLFGSGVVDRVFEAQNGYCSVLAGSAACALVF